MNKKLLLLVLMSEVRPTTPELLTGGIMSTAKSRWSSVTRKPDS